jgi:hypothetical protein
VPFADGSGASGGFHRHYPFRETEISRQDIVDLALIAALVAVGVYIIWFLLTHMS